MNVRMLARIGAALLCILAVPAVAQQNQSQGFPLFRPTTDDVAPGVDHGSNANLPEQFQRQAVYYRSQHPAGHEARKIGLPLDHLGRRVPIGPLGLA